MGFRQRWLSGSQVSDWANSPSLLIPTRDQAPPSPDGPLHPTYGDNFLAGSLDGKWTRRNLTTETFSANGLSSSLGAATADRMYLQPCPSGDFTIVMRMRFLSFGGANAMIGPIVLDSSGAGRAFSPYQDNSTYNWGVTGYVYSATSGAGGAQLWATLAGGAWFWMQFEKSGTSYSGRLSLDYTTWTSWATPTAWGGTPDRIGFGRVYGTAADEIQVSRFNVL